MENSDQFIRPIDLNRSLREVKSKVQNGLKESLSFLAECVYHNQCVTGTGGNH